MLIFTAHIKQTTALGMYPPPSPGKKKNITIFSRQIRL